MSSSSDSYDKSSDGQEASEEEKHSEAGEEESVDPNLELFAKKFLVISQRTPWDARQRNILKD